MSDEVPVCPYCGRSVADAQGNVTIGFSTEGGTYLRCASCGRELDFSATGAQEDAEEADVVEDDAEEELGVSEEVEPERTGGVAYESADQGDTKGWYVLPAILGVLVLIYILLILLNVIPNPF